MGACTKLHAASTVTSVWLDLPISAHTVLTNMFSQLTFPRSHQMDSYPKFSRCCIKDFRLNLTSPRPIYFPSCVSHVAPPSSFSLQSTFFPFSLIFHVDKEYEPVFQISIRLLIITSKVTEIPRFREISSWYGCLAWKPIYWMFESPQIKVVRLQTILWRQYF